MSDAAEVAEQMWSVLEHARKADFPPLIYRCVAHEDHLTLLVSDLVRVWDGSLSHQEVLDEAVRQSAPIDPSESCGQFKALTTRLLRSLKEGSTILASGRDNEPEFLYIQSSVKLPAPLTRLKWTFKLAEVDALTFARFITVPCLHEAHMRNAEVQSLLEVVKHKDHIIGKFLDQIESASSDLSIIFPGVPGLNSRKQSVRNSEAAKRVPGLAVFEEATWSKGLRAVAGSDYMHKSNLSTVFSLKAAESIVQSSATWTSKLPSTDAFDSSDVTGNRDVASRSISGSEVVPAGQEDAESTDTDGFEDIESTPSRNIQTSQKPREPSHSSSASDSDNSRKVVKTTGLNRPGIVGRQTRVQQTRNDRSGAPTPNPNSKPAATRLPGFGYASAFDSNSDSDSELDKPLPKPTQSQPKRKLGQIGGKTKYQLSQSIASSQRGASSSPRPSTPRKLGILGGKNKPSVSPSPRKSPSSNTTHTPWGSRLKSPLPRFSEAKEFDSATTTPSNSPSPSPSEANNHQSSTTDKQTRSSPSTRTNESQAGPKRFLDPNNPNPNSPRKKKRRF